jgi:hypothetical protein
MRKMIGRATKKDLDRRSAPEIDEVAINTRQKEAV